MSKLKMWKDASFRRKMSIDELKASPNHPVGDLDLSQLNGGGCTTPGNNSCTPIRGCGFFWSISAECNGGKSCSLWMVAPGQDPSTVEYDPGPEAIQL